MGDEAAGEFEEHDAALPDLFAVDVVVVPARQRVSPAYVRHNHRVAALIQVICLTLLVFCLIERQVRQALGPEKTMAGLYPDNRRVRPTGRMILYHPSELTLRIGNVTNSPTVQITRGVQLDLLDLLGIETTQTRWPQT
ncbi:hypothetical protein ACFVBM_08595 [Streptomyces griseus]|uniref:hypothetical protein n=1 Tax=Streptomyces griseus TaxID=1911 RepID=UPI0036B1A940